MELRQVFGTFNHTNGDPVVNGKVSFALVESDGFTTANFIVKGKKSITTDNAGDFSIDLWPNEDGESATYYICTSPSGDSFTFIMPSGTDPVNLTTLRALAPANPTPPTILDVIEDFLTGIAGAGTVTIIVNSPSSVWNITHNLNRFPSVTTIDSSGDVVIGVVDYIDANHLSITFVGANTGKVYLN